ncbi:hypothetical protein AAFF_G00164070 [Aldrovandia affinis]|uniref:Uncharacterized protein n=1 Tax=Aldrovandia affinis TaxID=143900 RepID=A0AAD7WX78_9TELE|nr:hypothetical protein AAFF_G00164070 [Aldrovandia affinis]
MQSVVGHQQEDWAGTHARCQGSVVPPQRPLGGPQVRHVTPCSFTEWESFPSHTAAQNGGRAGNRVQRGLQVWS